MISTKYLSEDIILSFVISVSHIIELLELINPQIRGSINFMGDMWIWWHHYKEDRQPRTGLRERDMPKGEFSNLG